MASLTLSLKTAPAAICIAQARFDRGTDYGMVLPEGTITILFTDVEKSTELAEVRGEKAAHEVLRKHRQLVREIVTTHAGHEVKSIGDGFMVAFPSASRAVSCAVAIQRALESHYREEPSDRVRVRMGLNMGEVIRDDEDLFGSAVNAASRIAARAAGGEILVSEAVRRVVRTGPDFDFVERGRVRLKGFADRWRLYQVLWKAGTTDQEVAAPRGELSVTRRGRTEARCSIGERARIGRDATSDVVLNSEFASRAHARVEWRDGVYVLVDEGSRNGTLLNGKRVSRPTKLSQGDEICIADFSIFFSAGAANSTTRAWSLALLRGTKGGDIELDSGSREVRIRGDDLAKRLSKQEFQLLELLYARCGDVVSKSEIGEAIWGERNFDDNYLHRLVFRVNEKIASQVDGARLIENVPGVGYRLLRQGLSRAGRPRA